MDDHERPAKSWRKYTPCGCLLLMVVVGIALPAIGWMVWSAKAARMVEDELAKVREANEPLEPSDLNQFYSLPDGQADTTQLWVDVIATFETDAFGEAAKEMPVVGNGPEIPPVGQEWDQLEAVEAFLAEYKNEMDLIHEAARIGGYARFDRDFDEGMAMALPNVQGIRSAARMLSLEARVAAHRGNPSGVANAIHAIFTTCNAVAEDPILVPQLVRIALSGVAASELQVAMESVELADDDLAMLREDLQAQNS